MNEMFIFRADGNPQIGAGHMMRCLSIAEQAEEPCLFVMAENHFFHSMIDREHQVFVLNTDYTQMEEELESFEDVIRSHAPSVLFVDSYFVTFDYLQSLKKLCREISCKLVYMDDMPAFSYPVDYLINYNIYGPGKKKDYEKMYSKEDRPHFLLGPAFVPLRAEFRNLPDRKVKQQAQNILISTGGADPWHMGMELVEYIMKKCDSDKYQFHIIIGAMNQDLLPIRQMTANVPNIIIHHNVANMRELMSACDVAVSAAGSTLYELCATQTPTITYILADNQIPGAEEFQRQGVLTCAGDIRETGAKRLAKDLAEIAIALAGDYGERVRIALAQKKIADGNGGRRIINHILYKGGEEHEL